MKPDPKALLERLTALESEISQLGNVNDSSTLGDLKTLLQQQQATDARDPKASALAILDRFLALDHQDQPGFQPLAQYKQQVRQFRSQVENASEHNLPQDVNALLTGKHPVAQLLKAVEEGDRLTDAQWATLQKMMENVFGQAIAIAVSRGKLYVSDTETAATPQVQPVSQPTPAVPQPNSGQDLLMWGDSTEKTPAAPAATATSEKEPLIVFGAKSLAPDAQGTIPLSVLVHIQGLGDRQFGAKEFAGTRGQSRGIEGLQIRQANPIPGLKLEYSAHLAGVGDTPWMSEGQYVGTRGENRQVEGFAVRLTGERASQYSVRYSAHVQNKGDTAVLADGQYCGTRGQSLRVEGLRVWIQPRG